MIELHLQNIVWHILGLGPKEGRLLTYRPGVIEKMKAFQALTKRWVTGRAHQQEIHATSIEVGRLNTQRNKVVHGIWGHEAGKPKALELLYINSTDTRLLPRVEKELSTLTGLKVLAGEIADLQYRLDELRKTLGAPPP